MSCFLPKGKKTLDSLVSSMERRVLWALVVALEHRVAAGPLTGDAPPRQDCRRPSSMCAGKGRGGKDGPELGWGGHQALLLLLLLTPRSYPERVVVVKTMTAIYQGFTLCPAAVTPQR